MCIRDRPYAREGADGQAVVCPLLRGSSPTRGVAPKQHRGLRRAFSPAFFGLVLFIPWRVGAEESGAAKYGFGPKPYFAAPDSSAPTRQGIKRTSPKNAGEKARRSPRCCFGATPLVGELPRSNGQTTAWPSAPPRA